MKQWVCILFIFLSVPVMADEILLNNKNLIQGDILERNDKSIRVRSSGMDVTYYWDEIESINGRDVEPPSALAVKSESSVNESADSLKKSLSVDHDRGQPVTALTDAGPTTMITESRQSTDEDSQLNEFRKENQRLRPIEGNGASIDHSSTASVKPSRLTAQQIQQFVAIILIVLLTIFFLACYPIYVISKKTGVSNPLFAFIPIMNVYLVCKIAGRPAWWVILYFIPIVNWVVDVLVWVDIAKRRNKPAFLGVLIVVPIANLIMPWYLALAE